MTATLPDRPVTLEDRYTRDEGQVLLNGTQALVRLLLTQRRLDAQRGLRAGMFVSGYPGSPLGGLDTENRPQCQIPRPGRCGVPTGRQ